MAKDTEPRGLLQGLRVVELGRDLAVPVAGMLLAEQGAEVLRITDGQAHSADPVRDALLARGKQELPLDLSQERDRRTLRRLVAQADVVLENRALGDMERLGLDFERIRREVNPGLISCSIPPFAVEDPRASLPAFEAVAGTAGFLYHKPIGMPQHHRFPLGSVLAGLFGLNAVLAALVARERMGRGQHVESSTYGSDIFAQILLVLMKTGIPRGFVPLKMVGTPFMGSWLCGDQRYIYLHITLPAHNARILEILDENGYAEQVADLRSVLSAETMRDPSQVKSIPEAKKIRERYERIFLSKSADEWEELLGGELCCIKVRTIEEWLPDSLEAGMEDACTVDDPVFGELLATGAAVTAPDFPPRLEARRSAAGAERDILARWEDDPRPDTAPDTTPDSDLRHPLQGLRVLDLSRIIAGPCAARILAELGADVLSVQSPTGLDWALSFHLLFNTGKRSVTLDFTGDEGKKKLWAIAHDFKPHAFIQNYRHLELAARIGVDPESMRQHFPDIVYTHLNAYGDKGVWRDRPGFEQVVQAVSGIQMSYGRDGVPKLLPTPVIDIGSGLLGASATLLGLYHQARTGRGVFSATHLTRMAVLFQLDWIADFQREKCLQAARTKGSAVTMDPQQEVLAHIFRARDGFACATGRRHALEAWLRAAGLARSGTPWHAALARKRVKARSIAHWQASLAQAGQDGDAAVIAVPPMGSLCKDIRKYDNSPIPLVRRRDFPGCPSELTFVRSPMRLSATPMKDADPPPMRGQHTREVMALIGEQVPEGAGVIPYPEAKPVLVWLSTLIRWGYFAWRSGNI